MPGAHLPLACFLHQFMPSPFPKPMSDPSSSPRLPLASLRPLGRLAFALTATLLAINLPGQAGSLFVPNHSFESPATEFVDNTLHEWEAMPKPEGYDESGGFLWSQLTGVFRNTAPGSADHLVNLDGHQALYLFAAPLAGVFRDLRSTDTSPETEDEPFEARFEPGWAYRLTAGVVGGGGNMAPGASLQLGLYYRDAGGAMVIVAATNIVHDPALFPTNTHLVEFAVRVPTVRTNDAWAGRTIGIRILSTVDPSLAGGYWDVDTIRLEDVLEVPNGSFESPSTDFVDNRVDAWRKTPKPDGYDESSGFTWDQLSGVFRNTAPGSPDHLDNLDGQQAFYLFAVPGVGLTLDAAGTPDPTPFPVRFEPGRRYRLTAGVVGGAAPITPGATLEVALYHLGTSDEPATVASTPVVFDPARFPNINHFTDIEVDVPGVQPGDPWAGRPLGIRLLSTVSPEQSGGYWDIDHLRLSSHRVPMFLPAITTPEALRLVLRSEPGDRLEIQSTASLPGPAAAWTRVTEITNRTGTRALSLPLPGPEPVFYRAVTLP